jgi:hypothetical protein
MSKEARGVGTLPTQKQRFWGIHSMTLPRTFRTGLLFNAGGDPISPRHPPLID